MEYNIGDKIVYPMHGAGVIEAIEEKEIMGATQTYYIMRIPIGDMKVMIPTKTAKEIGAELDLIRTKCKELGVNVALSEVWAKGGEGGKALAEEVVRLCEEPSDFKFCYSDEMSIMEKLNAIATRIYHADGVDLVGNAPKQLKQLEDMGFGNMPICMAKTQYSFSDDPTRLYRAARFAGRFGWTIDRKTSQLMSDASREEYPFILSRERVRQEFIKILEEKNT